MSSPLKWPRVFRAGRATDLPLVLDSWQRSYARSPSAGVVPNHIWFQVMRTLITGLLARGAALVIAVNPEDADQILGWCCYERDADKLVIHYIFVKEPFRQDGMALELFGEAMVDPDVTPRPVYYTHRAGLNTAGDALVRSITSDFKLVYAPEIARRKDF